jgi:hypothetical protein
MCIAILNIKNTIKREYIFNSYENNYHGAGFAYSDGSKLNVYKTDKGATAFYKAYKAARKKNPDVPFLLHFRISTHGTITKDNLHPFVINDKVAFIHNGMVDLKGHTYHDHRSDTRFLCEEFLAKLPDGWQHSEGVHNFLEEIGGWSKFVMLDVDHNWSIVNEHDGHWYQDNWYSNTSYKSYSSKINYGGKMVDRSTVNDAYSTNSKSYEKAWADWGTSSSANKKQDEVLSLSTKVENKLHDIGFMPKSGYAYNAIMGERVIESYEQWATEALSSADYYGTTAKLIADGVTYFMPDNKQSNNFKSVNVTIGDKTVTCIKDFSKELSSAKILPFAIYDKDLLGHVLTEFNKGNDTFYKFDSEILRTAMDNYERVCCVNNPVVS